MQDRKCTICETTKPASEFYVTGKYLYSHCKVCKREKDKSTYHNDKKDRESRRTRVLKANYIRQLKAKIFVYDILSKSKCIDCGESRLETLDFDHVRGTKYKSISTLIKQGRDINKIENEISKCDIRCSNCHRIRTSKELGWDRTTWDIEKARFELENRLQQVPKRKPSSKRKRRKNVGKLHL